MVLLAGRGRRVSLQLRAFADALARAVNHAAQRNRALGDIVHELSDAHLYGVKKLMHGDEIRPLHVPVRLLEAEPQIDRIDKARV